MNYITLFLYVGVNIVMGFKVNVQGKLTLGNEVVESLIHYLGKDVFSGRRSWNPLPIEDPITLTVRSAIICKDLDFCEDDMHHFVNEYIIILANAATTILGTLKPDFNKNTFKEHLKHILTNIRKILEEVNEKIVKETNAYYWIHVIKRINAQFQRLTDETHNAVPTDLRHKIIIATAFIERKYLRKLCAEYNICSKSYQCTEALNKILTHFKTLPEDRIRLFVKKFYDSLFDSSFYSHLNQTTANDFQIILSDMSYANDTPTKDVMLAVQRTVEARMKMIETHTGIVVVHEILIAHTILSDVDHMFSNHTNAFTMFLNKFYDWLASDVQLDKHIRTVLSDIGNQISTSEKDLVQKLIEEVKVFLEMTVNSLEKKTE